MAAEAPGGSLTQQFIILAHPVGNSQSVITKGAFQSYSPALRQVGAESISNLKADVLKAPLTGRHSVARRFWPQAARAARLTNIEEYGRPGKPAMFLYLPIFRPPT